MGFVYDRYDQIPTSLLAAAGTSNVRRVLVRHPDVTILLERGDRSIERARLEVGEAIREAREVIEALPKTIRELRVVTGEIDRGAMVALTSAARALPALEVREIGPAR
jgi:hypothetical protein